MTFSASTLLLANLITIILFFMSGGSLMQVLWIYWAQSIIIGAINVIRILISPIKITTADGEPVSLPSFVFNKAFTATFFTFHYGFFHYLYFTFLTLFSTFPVLRGPLNLADIFISCFFFGIHHVIAFVSEQRIIWKDPTQKPDLKTVMMKPYYRIFPMHFILMFALFGGLLLGNTLIAVVFMILKTIVDQKLYNRITSVPAPTKPGDI